MGNPGLHLAEQLQGVIGIGGGKGADRFLLRAGCHLTGKLIGESEQFICPGARQLRIQASRRANLLGQDRDAVFQRQLLISTVAALEQAERQSFLGSGLVLPSPGFSFSLRFRLLWSAGFCDSRLGLRYGGDLAG